jgi:hypothetical protein
MAELSSEIAPPPSTDRFRWSIAAYAVVATSIVSISIDLSNSWDLLGFLYVLLIVPIIAICMLAVCVFKAIRRKPRASASLVAALIVYCSVSFLMVKGSADLHGEILWLLHSKQYKAEVLAQPADGSLKHIEWYGWGMFAQDTSAYLTYDPSNSLAHRDPATGRFGVLRCDEVWRVRRLEDHWYSVTFDTNEVWDTSCDTDAPSP